MDLGMQTIAQRKAARKSSLLQSEPAQAAPSANAPIADILPTLQAAPAEIVIEKTPEPGAYRPPASHRTEAMTSAHEPAGFAPRPNEAQTSAQSPVPAASKPRIKALSTAGTAFNKETLLAMAKTMGLELAAAKKIWIKHSFSITPETKEGFQKRCHALGFKMQDAMEEALLDWFSKHEHEYQAITEAKSR